MSRDRRFLPLQFALPEPDRDQASHPDEEQSSEGHRPALDAVDGERPDHPALAEVNPSAASLTGDREGPAEAQHDNNYDPRQGELALIHAREAMP